VRAHVAVNIARFQGKFLWRNSYADKHLNMALYRFFNWLSFICKQEFSPEDLNSMHLKEKELIDIARTLPATLHNISLHILYHLPAQIKRYGPLRETWAFGFERMLAFLKKGINNKALPSASMLSFYMLNIHTLTKYSMGLDENINALDEQSVAIVKASSAFYPLSTIKKQLALHNMRTAINTIIYTPNILPVIYSLDHQTLTEINDCLFYSNDIAKNAWLKYADEMNAICQSDMNMSFRDWALHKNNEKRLSIAERRLAAGFLPQCGYFFFFSI
jgi:hypothetical protein